MNLLGCIPKMFDFGWRMLKNKNSPQLYAFLIKIKDARSL
jgi:hypothetical protein